MEKTTYKTLTDEELKELLLKTQESHLDCANISQVEVLEPAIIIDFPIIDGVDEEIIERAWKKLKD